jgi:hypothetical protein
VNKDGRLMIATGVIGIVSVLFLAALIANGWTQIKQTGLYIIPDALVNILNLVFGASVTILGLGGIAAARANNEGKAIDDKEKNK